jgi:hypothetical protein
MQLYRHFAVAAALLLCSIATASAAGTGLFLVASDDFVLTGAQEQLLWQRIGRNASITTPSGLIAAVGATLPASVALLALPATVTRQIPALRPYKYAMLGKTLLIINRPGHRRRHYAITVTTAPRESSIAIWSVAFAETTAYELVTRSGINRRWEAVAW